MRFTAWSSKVERQMYRYHRLKEWHAWFAWKPVRIVEQRTGLTKVVWLEVVMRRWVPIDPVRNARLAFWDYDFATWYC